MLQLSKEIRKEPKKNKKSKVILPNDKEILIMKRQIKKGVKINLENYRELKKLSEKFNLKF
jgi:LDH2 family malate/lactate/ureidoglycolate dehydrogenase